MKHRKHSEIAALMIAATMAFSALFMTSPAAFAAGNDSDDPTAATKTAQLIWTEDNATATFLYSETEYREGGKYDGQTITEVWSGTDVTDSGEEPDWAFAFNEEVNKVVFDKSFASVKPSSIGSWFLDFSALISIQGLQYLDTTNVLLMGGTFAMCTSLTSLDLSGFHTEKAVDMVGMFYGCSKLITLDLGSFDVSKVKDATDMFADCPNLKTIFCSKSNSEWTFSSNYEGGTLFDNNDALQGRYGSKTVPYNANERSIDSARSAKNGGYFTPRTMTITFKANGGGGTMNAQVIPSRFYSTVGTALSANSFTREGFAFTGWNTKADGSGSAYEDQASMRPSKDYTLYAQWHKLPEWNWTRLAGDNRYHTATLASQEVFEDGSCEKIIIASGQAFPDALSGSALAGALGCPILLTNTKKLADETKAEIQRLAAPNCQVLILGGTGAVSEAAERAIKNLGIEGLTTKRVAGENRDETMRAVYAEGNFPAGGTIIVATGYAFADVLSISPYAYAAKAPIILTKKNGSLTPEAKALIENEAKPSKVIIIGGIGVVTGATENYLKGLSEGVQVMRLAGGTRYETSAEIMKWELGLNAEAPFQPDIEMNVDGMGVATGTGFADALGATSLLGKIASPLLLVADNSKNNRAATQANISELVAPFTRNMTKAYIFGGTGAVSERIEGWLNEAIQ